MRTEAFESVVNTAYGKDLPSPVTVKGTYEHLEHGKDAIPADEQLTEKDIYQVVNAKRKASARASATTAALEAAGIKKPDTNTLEYAREQQIKSFVKLLGISEEQASAIVDSAMAAAKAAAGATVTA